MNNTERFKRLLEDLQINVTDVGFVQVSALWKHHNHLNSNNCLYYFLEGEGVIQIQGETFYPAPGDLLLLPAGAKISYSSSEAHPFRKYYCHFHATVGTLPLFQLIQVPLRIGVTDHKRLSSLFELLNLAYIEEDTFGTLKVKGIMFELLGFIWSQEEARIELSRPVTGDRWNEILQYFEEHITETVSIEQVALAFNFSPKYFFRYFKQTFAITPHQFMIKLKMERAKQLLLTTDWQISYIANVLGLERTNFSRLFHKHYNMSPRQFKSVKDKQEGGVKR